MKHTFLFFIAFIALVACNNSDPTKSTSDIETGKEFDTERTARQTLIGELKKLQQVVASKNKEKIADIFQFPLSDTAYSIYVDNENYYEQFKNNGNKTTKAMFLSYFKDISESIWLDQLNNLFQSIKVDSLLHHDKLNHDDYLKTQPCYYSYQIEIDKSTVTLSMSMNSNKDYKSKNISEYEIPENSSEICEHAFWWTFIFDGKELTLKGFTGAG
ncbi:MAG: hypothetical protein KF862_27180 [Chitinophagaceae bacterium]|nr:hypothetical protein [Chitinophagaceae bacterium]